jgi:hypothetical protein
MSPPLLHLPNRRIRNICTKRSPETPHDRACHLSAIHACVVVAFVVLVLLGEEPTVFVALRHYRLRGGLGADGVRGGHYCGCRARRGLIGTVGVSMRQGCEQKTWGALLSQYVIYGLQTAGQLQHALLSTVQVWYDYCRVCIAVLQYHGA